MQVLKIFAVVLLLCMGEVQAKESFMGEVSRVADGDTLWVRPASGGRPLKLRLEGIDAPEICQSGGEASRTMLSQLVLNQRVQVTVNRRDDYGRGLARLHVGGEDVAARMVSSGQAWSYRWRRSLGPYAAQEQQARQERQGLFAVANAELPRDFRKRHGSCFPDIKGR